MKGPYVVGAGLVVAGVLAWLMLGDVGENLVYYWSPSEMSAAGGKAVGATIRLGGVVVPGSVKQDGTELRFKVTDNTTTVDVLSHAVPPAMFREGIGVVVEGTATPEGTFASQRLMVKHDNQYKPPTDGKMPDKEMAFQTVEENP